MAGCCEGLDYIAADKPRTAYDCNFHPAKAAVAISKRKIKTPVMYSKHLMRMVTVMALFIIDPFGKAQLSRPILVIDRIDAKSYIVRMNNSVFEFDGGAR